MLKKIIILIIPFLLTGCGSVNYNLNINKDLTVEEQVFMTATEEYFDIYYKNFPKTIVKNTYDDPETMKPLIDNNYQYELKTDNQQFPGILAKKKFNSLLEYTNKTVFKGQAFKNISTTTKDSLVTLKATDLLPYILDEDVDYYLISRLKITIKLPYIVTSNNADSVNEKTNTYTWKIDEKTKSKEINITFDKSKIYIYKNDLIKYISIFLICVLIILLITYFRKIIKKNKFNNQFND